MNQYPRYETSSEVRGKKFTVKVWAATKCGPTVRAHATVTIRPQDTLEKLERDVTPTAVRNLGHEYDEIVARCIAKRRHQGHA